MFTFQPYNDNIPVQSGPSILNVCLRRRDDPRDRTIWLLANSPGNRRALLTLLSLTGLLTLLKQDTHTVNLVGYVLETATTRNITFATTPSSQLFNTIVTFDLLAATVWTLNETAFPRCTVLQTALSSLAVLLFTLFYSEAVIQDIYHALVTLICKLLFPPANHPIRIFSFAYTSHATIILLTSKLLPHLLVVLIQLGLPADFAFASSYILFSILLVPLLLSCLWSNDVFNHHNYRQTPLPYENRADSDDCQTTRELYVATANIDDRSRRILLVARNAELLNLCDENNNQVTSKARSPDGYATSLRLLDCSGFFDRAMFMIHASKTIDKFDAGRETVALFLGSAILSCTVCFVYTLGRRRVEFSMQANPLPTYPRNREDNRCCRLYYFYVLAGLFGFVGFLLAKCLLLAMQLRIFALNESPRWCIILAATFTGFHDLIALSLTDLYNANYLTEKGKQIAQSDWLTPSPSQSSLELKPAIKGSLDEFRFTTSTLLRVLLFSIWLMASAMNYPFVDMYLVSAIVLLVALISLFVLLRKVYCDLRQTNQ